MPTSLKDDERDRVMTTALSASPDLLSDAGAGQDFVVVTYSLELIEILLAASDTVRENA